MASISSRYSSVASIISCGGFSHSERHFCKPSKSQLRIPGPSAFSFSSKPLSRFSIGMKTYATSSAGFVGEEIYYITGVCTTSSHHRSKRNVFNAPPNTAIYALYYTVLTIVKWLLYIASWDEAVNSLVPWNRNECCQ
jgi:hypothetical protein